MSDSLKIVHETEKPWLKDGLRFSCTQCGKCCTGSPGYVWVDEEEIAEMAAFLKITSEEFKSRYTRQAYGKISLLEDRSSFDCIFLKNRMCQVYGARPRQCKTFPWWPENIASPEEWEKTAQRCEGIHPEAPLVPVEEIAKQIDIFLNRAKKG